MVLTTCLYFQQMADNILPLNKDDSINDISLPYAFDTFNLLVSSGIVFPLKKILKTNEHSTGKGGGASYIVTTGASADAVGSPNITGSKHAALQNDGTVDAKQYGIFTGSDVSTAFNAMQDAGVPCRIEGSIIYTINSPVIVKVETIAYNGRAILDADSLPALSVAMSCTNESDIIGLDVDCANTSSMQTGYSHRLDFEPTRQLKLDVIARNVTNLDVTKPAYGCLLFLGSGDATNNIHYRAKLEAHNILASGGQPCKGVISSINKAGVQVDVYMDNTRASKIYPRNDGDGIHMLDADHLNPLNTSTYFIQNPVASDCDKRGMKSQAPNITWNSPFINLDLNDGVGSSTLAIDTYGVNCKVLNPTVFMSTVGSADGSIQANGTDFLCVNPIFICSAGQNFLRMNSGAYNYRVDGGKIIAPKTYASADFRLVLVEGDAWGSIALDSVINASKTATVINYFGTSGKNTFSVKGHCEASTLVSANFSTVAAKININEGYGSFSGNILKVLGNDWDYNITGIDAVTTGNNSVVTAAPIRFHGTNKLESVVNGILYNGNKLNAKITGDMRLIATAGTGTGVDLGGTIDATIASIESSGFATHIAASFSTDTAIMNNLARGGGTAISAPSSTRIITGNNLEVA